MRKASWLVCGGLVLTLWGWAKADQGFTTELRSMGYSLIPAPQKVTLDGGQVTVDCTWDVVSEVAGDHIALRRLGSGARELHGLDFSGTGKGRVILRLEPGAVMEAANPALKEQAYRLRISPSLIEVTGNGDAGLFYGVQSLLQLLRGEPGGPCFAPSGTIVDWPALELRFIHWDTKHHQDRPETLRRYLDWAAFFKVNAIGFEIEDKYEYPRHPVIGAPGAFTRQEMQELTAYALERFIQLVPQIQAPAHMAYVLKHDQFAHLRSDGSNYQACMCDEEAMELIQDMYQDLIDATPGMKYFHASTDEVYYAGICKKCRRPYNDENRSQAWVDYVRRMHSWLAERGRRMLCWVEYPLLAEQILQLPQDLLDGVTYPDPEYIRNKNKVGMEGLAYSSIQGSELLFPNYFPCTYRGVENSGRLTEIPQAVPDRRALGARLIGTYAAAWDDSGLHNETFWLGWATVAQYGWTPDKPALEQSVADFMDVFYAPGNGDMTEIYRSLIEGARFFESSLDRVPSAEAPPAYGNPYGKGRNTTRIDLRLEPPALPFGWDMYIIAEPTFSRRYGQILARAREQRLQLDRTIYALEGRLDRKVRNRYNLDVLLSIACFERHFVEMLLGLERVEKLCLEASKAFSEEDARRAAGHMVAAHNQVKKILEDRSEMWGRLKAVWGKSRFEKGREFGGRKFVHKLDDLKDHFADRRPGLEYMLAPYERMGLEDWNRRLAGFIESFAKSHGFEPQGLEK
ncbi:MAG TPA: beta-N-acetylhexosaminidase [archaeon]|nr:beta-N-acetylhexosaminidase [archaeon]